MARTTHLGRHQLALLGRGYDDADNEVSFDVWSMGFFAEQETIVLGIGIGFRTSYFSHTNKHL